MKSDTYKNIEELIEILEKIKSEGHGALGIPKAIYLIALEIQDIKKELSRLQNDTT
jgi:hypothetical protein